MSIDAMNWAMSVETGKASYKSVLVALAHCHHSRTGLCHPSISTLSTMTELNRKTVMPALEWLRISGLISFDPRNRAARKYELNIGIQNPKNGTIEKQGRSTSFGTKESKSQSPKNGHAKSQKRTKEVPKTGHNKEYKELTRNKYTSEHLRLAEWMSGIVQQKTQSNKTPNYDKWADDVRKINELDGRDLRLIAETFKWSSEHHFWSAQILCPSKLREKFNQLFAQMGSEGHRGAKPEKQTAAQRQREKLNKLESSPGLDAETVDTDDRDVRPPMDFIHGGRPELNVV